MLAAEDQDADNIIQRTAKSADDVDLSASDSGSAALDKLNAERAKRLEAMGAAEVVPPKEERRSVPRGSGFAISNADAGKEAAEAALYRMRRKENGQLEDENKDAIARAQRAAKQWLDAGLGERARSELEQVEKLCSYKTAAGAKFHLFLAQVHEANGQKAQARRVLQRVQTDAEGSTYRWQAEQALERGTSSGARAPKSDTKSEYSSLFNMPDAW